MPLLQKTTKINRSYSQDSQIQQKMPDRKSPDRHSFIKYKTTFNYSLKPETPYCRMFVPYVFSQTP